MATAAEKRKDDVRLRRTNKRLERQAEHLEEFAARCADPLTKDVAFAICRSVYHATGCACEKRPDMDVCSSMTSAALSAINRVRRATLPQTE